MCITYYLSGSSTLISLSVTSFFYGLESSYYCFLPPGVTLDCREVRLYWEESVFRFRDDGRLPTFKRAGSRIYLILFSTCFLMALVISSLSCKVLILLSGSSSMWISGGSILLSGDYSLLKVFWLRILEWLA